MFSYHLFVTSVLSHRDMNASFHIGLLHTVGATDKPLRALHRCGAASLRFSNRGHHYEGR